jgi:hypothetical protein
MSLSARRAPGGAPQGAALGAADLWWLSLAARLPLAWTTTARRRRLLLLALAAPGFLQVVTTPMHRSFLVMVGGVLLFEGAMIFRRGSEPAFLRAEAAELWPPLSPSPWRHPDA